VRLVRLLFSGSCVGGCPFSLICGECLNGGLFEKFRIQKANLRALCVCRFFWGVLGTNMLKKTEMRLSGISNRKYLIRFQLHRIIIPLFIIHYYGDET